MSEAQALLRYAMSGSGKEWEPSEEDIARYERALTVHGIPLEPTLDASVITSPRRLRSLDAYTRLRFPHCALQQKLLIAAAIAECNPASAEWLLPRDRSRREFFTHCFWLGMRSILVLLVALPLALQTSYVRRNAGL